MGTRRGSTIHLVLFTVFLVQQLSASQHWISVATPHFEMYTTNSPAEAAGALRVLEQARSFFVQRDGPQQVPQGQVRILAFSSEQEYAPYRTSPDAFAYYVRNWGQDVIVMQDIAPGHSQAAVHEYTHLVMRNRKQHLPVWLNEGVAELYSSLEAHGQQSSIGSPLPMRVDTLRHRKWMDWNELFETDPRSAVSGAAGNATVYYAQSWLLTHMLFLSPLYAPGFSKFLSAAASGSSTPAALQAVYGKTLPEVEQDVAEYWQQPFLRVLLYDINSVQPDLRIQISDLPYRKIELALANLLACRDETVTEAQERLSALARQFPDSPEIIESLGYLAWQNNNLLQARKYFASAVTHGSKNTQMIYDLARLEQTGGASPQFVIGLLEKVITLQPDHSDAGAFLATLRYTFVGKAGSPSPKFVQ